MIERAGQGAFDYLLHGGADRTRIQWYFLEQSRLPVAVQMWELPPGGSEGAHSHSGDRALDELYLVVEGSAVMNLDGTRHHLGPGDALLAQAGTDHDLTNQGTSALKVLVIWGSPAPADWSGYGSAKAARAARTATG